MPNYSEIWFACSNDKHHICLHTHNKTQGGQGAACISSAEHKLYIYASRHMINSKFSNILPASPFLYFVRTINHFQLCTAEIASREFTAFIILPLFLARVIYLTNAAVGAAISCRSFAGPHEPSPVSNQARIDSRHAHHFLRLRR